MKSISLTFLLVAGAASGFAQAPHRQPLSTIFKSKLAFYLPEPDSTPISTSVVVTSSQSTTIAPNTWIEIHGTNLAQTVDTWSNSDFSHGLPTNLDGVTAMVNNKQAAVYYVSPTQINVLVPLDNSTGPVPVQVTTAYGTTTAMTPTMQSLSPGLLVFDVAGHITAQHTDYSLMGPPSSSVPGYTFTSAKPNETILVYGVGFGATNPPITNELVTAAVPLPTLPTATIGGLPAQVTFAGLVQGAGLYQLNVVVPPGAPNGDLVIQVSYGGAKSQTALINVHN